MSTINDILKESSNPSYRTIEEAIPEYFKVVEFYEEIIPFISQEEEKKLFQFINKMGIMAYQVINNSFNNTLEHGKAKGIKNIDIERILIEYIITITKHVLEIAEWCNQTPQLYIANKQSMEYLHFTIKKGTYFENVLENYLKEYD